MGLPSHVSEDDVIEMAVCIERCGNNLLGMKMWRWQTEPYPSLTYSVAVLNEVKYLGLGLPPAS